MIRREVIAAGLLTLACASTALAARYERSIEVPAAGWYRVALDADAVVLGAESGWAVLDPAGRTIPQTVLRPADGTVAATTLAVTETADGWTVVFDLGGRRPVRHARLDLEAVRRISAGECVLEAGEDGRSWRPLARARLFWLGEASQLRRSSIEYEPVTSRFLRLHWPRAAGFPELRSATVDALPWPPVQLELTPEPGVSGPSRSSWRIPVPATRAPIQRSVVHLSAAATTPIHYRLDEAVGALWRVRREGRVPVGADAIVHDGIAPFQTTLRLDLLGDSHEVRPTAVTWELAPVWLMIRADRAGTYTLRCGRLDGDPASPEIADVDSVVAAAWLTPGARRASPRSSPGLPDDPPPRPRELPAPRAAWHVRTGAAAPGEVVRLSLTPDVLVERDRGSRLHLLADGREVPFAIHAPAEPLLALHRRAGTPAETSDDRFRYVVDDEEVWSAMSWLEWFVRADAVDETAAWSVRLRTRGRPGVTSQPLRRTGRWSCDGPLCRAALDRIPADTTSLEIELTAGAAGSPAVEVLGWRRSLTAAFVRPDASDLKLVAVRHSGRAGDTWSNDAVRLVEAAVGSADLEPAPLQHAFVRRVGLWAALLAVGAMLLWILARSLRRDGPAPGRS